MPRITVQANPQAGEDARVTLSERLIAENLDSPHYTAQLLERVAWATADAEALESIQTPTSHAERTADETVEPNPRVPPKPAGRARVLISTLALLIVAALSIAPAALAAPARDHDGNAADPNAGLAVQWYDITNDTITAAEYPEPVFQSRAWSVSWLAAARAARDDGKSSAAAAAFAQAVHDTLAALVPSRRSQLDSDLAATLAAIPDGPAKGAAIATGEQEAAAALARRQGDGLDTASVDSPFTPPSPGPGVWQPTPPAFAPALRAGEGNARPFLLAAADQFDPGSPPALDSNTYLADLAEVRADGSATSAARTTAQTDIALFWEPAINIQYVQLLRAVLADTDRPLSWQARFVAAFNVITTDAQIAIYNAKFKYRFWRPVTAIRTGTVDPDPSWTPLFTTPRYPDWPSGHGGVAGAAQQVLNAFLGQFAPAPITLTSPTDPGSTHTYDSWSQITHEVIDARVWEGIHFRFSDLAGAREGSEVADYDLDHLRALGL